MGGWRNGSASDSRFWKLLKVTGSNPVSLICFLRYRVQTVVCGLVFERDLKRV